jgi:hypothetical protein
MANSTATRTVTGRFYVMRDRFHNITLARDGEPHDMAVGLTPADFHAVDFDPQTKDLLDLTLESPIDPDSPFPSLMLRPRILALSVVDAPREAS